MGWAVAKIDGYTMRVRKWMLLSLLVLAGIPVLPCAAQSKKVMEQKLHLDDNPMLTQRCPSNDYMHVNWIDDQTLLISFVLQPCGKGNKVKFGYTTLDLQGKTIGYADSDSGTMEPGPNGEILAQKWKKYMQLLDSHFAVIKTIDCDTEKCTSHVSADRIGFAVCRTYDKSDCRYFRGPKGDDAKAEDFPDGFPDRYIHQQGLSQPSKPERYPVAGDEVWFFDESSQLFRSISGGPPIEIPNPASSIFGEDCSAIFSREGRRRFLSDCSGGLGFGSEMVLYMFRRYVLYDVPTHKVLLKLSSNVDEVRMSPDGSRIADVIPAHLGGLSSMTIYYAP